MYSKRMHFFLLMRTGVVGVRIEIKLTIVLAQDLSL